MNFNEFKLDARLKAGIAHAGFETPTPIQESAIPLALEGRDLIGTAQTGTGKTAAFVLPILHKLLSSPNKGTRALIITPTRELAEQINQTITILKRGTNIRSMTVYGGVGAKPQIDKLRKGFDIVVACPGRLLDHINNNYAKLGKIEILVLDEADRMLDMGFLPDIKRILKHLPAKRQSMLFSATFPKEIEKLGRQTLINPKRVAIGMVAPAHTVSHTLYPVAQHLKKGLLMRLLKQTDTNSVLVFTRTKHRAKRLGRQIETKGYTVTTLHGNRTQGQRSRALEGFKKGTFQIMVATDIAARGLDIASISHVINYDMPDTEDAYIHRIGRAGRAERAGEAFTLTTPEDAIMIKRIEKVMKQPLERRTLEDFDYDAAKPDYPKNDNRKSRPRRNNSSKNSNSKNANRNKRSQTQRPRKRQ